METNKKTIQEKYDNDKKQLKEKQRELEKITERAIRLRKKINFESDFLERVKKIYNLK